MTQSEDSSSDGAPVSGAPDPADAEAARERPSVRWAHLEPVRVGWIVDAQREFLDPGGRCRVFGGDGVVEVSASEAVAALTRVAEWMGGRCPVLVCTVDWPGATDSGIAAGGPGPARRTPGDRAEPWPDGEEDERARVIAAIRPAGPLVLGPNADDEQGEDLGYGALEEGRAVVAHRRFGGGFEEHTVCGAFLAAVEDAYNRPVEIVVAGVARDGTVARVVDGLLSHGHRVTVVRDAIFTTGPEPETEPVSGWAGGGTVVSLAELRHAVEDSRQISFADIQIAEAYEHLDRLLNGPSDSMPLPKLDDAVPWELFRRRLEAARRSQEDLFQPRDPLTLSDPLVMFKSILLGAVYKLSDDHLELLLHDRLSFKRFAGLGVTDEPPRARLLRIQRERWTKAGVLPELAADVDRRWHEVGYRFQGMRTLMGLSSPAREDAEAGQPKVPGPEPEVRTGPKGGGGKKRLSRSQRRKRRRKRK